MTTPVPLPQNLTVDHWTTHWTTEEENILQKYSPFKNYQEENILPKIIQNIFKSIFWLSVTHPKINIQKSLMDHENWCLNYK